MELFGKDLHTWLYADPGGWNALPLAYSTWLEGGCWLLARALHEWIGDGSTMWTLYSSSLWDSTTFPQHVVVKVGECFLDGDGASTEQQLLHRWVTEERVLNPGLKPFILEEAEEYGIECPIGALRDLARGLSRTFGSGDAVLRWVE